MAKEIKQSVREMIELGAVFVLLGGTVGFLRLYLPH
jgi:hypothetical protein